MGIEITFWRALAELEHGRKSYCIVTLVDVALSAPQAPGAKAIFTVDGLFWGTVGGGRVEAKVQSEAMAMLAGQPAEPRTRFHEWNLRQDVGMTCGGVASFYFELVTGRESEYFIFGAGHVGQALVPLLLTLPGRVNVWDDRDEWLGRLPDHPNLSVSDVSDLADFLQDSQPSDFFVSVSQGHRLDVPIVAAVLGRFQPRYLGVIGSAAKARVLKRSLRELGFGAEQLDNLRCPVGLPLGGRTPAEIAISIAADLVVSRNTPGSLAD